MPRASRFVRPASPRSALVLQPRDLAIVHAVFKHRYLRSEHIHQLLFKGLSSKVCRVRLRKLWEHRFLDRHFLPCVANGVLPIPTWATQPIYGLGENGGNLLVERTVAPEQEVQNQVRNQSINPNVMQHDLVAIDFLVSLQVACLDNKHSTAVTIENESALRTKLSQSQVSSPNILPDASFTLVHLPDNQKRTYYLEIVRADVKSGNRTLLQKMRRYVNLNHRQYFKTVYNHQSVRAVLIATSSETRVENFKRLAGDLRYGRNFFWFGTYGQTERASTTTNSFQVDRILTPIWQDWQGNQLSLLD